MKAYDAITEVNNLAPNQYDNAVKLKWLADLDGRIFRELIERRQPAGTRPPRVTPLDQENVCAVCSLPSPAPEDYDYPAKDYSSTDVTLLVPEPWARDVYVSYLRSRIAEANAEADRYNLYAAVYNSAYAEFAAWYNRMAILPKGTGWRY